jgi:hypothetical protein
MRQERTRVIPEQVIPEWTVHYTMYLCDGCGREIRREDLEDEYAHELQIVLDQDECVNFLRMRDYCPSCLEPVWNAINKLLGTDPRSERDREYD